MSNMELTVRMPVIGVVRSSHRELETTPIHQLTISDGTTPGQLA
jgi:hypothetical protein